MDSDAYQRALQKHVRSNESLRAPVTKPSPERAREKWSPREVALFPVAVFVLLIVVCIVVAISVSRGGSSVSKQVNLNSSVSAPSAARTLKVAAQGRSPGDYGTIRAALASARAGDTVLVASGVYEECIEMKSGVTLRGADMESTIIRNRSLGASVVYAGSVSAATLSDFTIEQLLEQTGDSRRAGIHLANSSVSVRNCRVRSSGSGIDITGTGNFVVSSCRIEDCDLVGIIVYDSSQVDLLDNICSDNKGWGIAFSNGSKGRVEGNNCNRNKHGGLAFLGSSTRVRIARNIANGNGGPGIAVETVCRPLSFENNRASGNKQNPQIDRNAAWRD